MYPDEECGGTCRPGIAECAAKRIAELEAQLAKAEDSGRAEGMRCLRWVLVGRGFIEMDDELDTLDTVRVLLTQWQRQRRKIEDVHSVLELVKAQRDDLRVKLSGAEYLLGEAETGAVQVNLDLARGREIEQELHVVKAKLADAEQRITDLEAQLAEADKNCAQHMRNIKTWMKKGFNGHCTDAMIIMAERVEKAERDRDELRAKLEKIQGEIDQGVSDLTGGQWRGCPVVMLVEPARFYKMSMAEWENDHPRCRTCGMPLHGGAQCWPCQRDGLGVAVEEQKEERAEKDTRIAELEAKLTRAETRERDMEVVNARVEADYAELERERDELNAKLAEVARERDEALAKLANASMEWMFEHATRLRSALRATTEGCLPDDKMEAQPAKLLARAEQAERERDEGQKRIEKLDAALQFYAGRKREDGNGYEFDDEPSRISGGVARAALKGGA